MSRKKLKCKDTINTATSVRANYYTHGETEIEICNEVMKTKNDSFLYILYANKLILRIKMTK